MRTGINPEAALLRRLPESNLDEGVFTSTQPVEFEGREYPVDIVGYLFPADEPKDSQTDPLVIEVGGFLTGLSANMPVGAELQNEGVPSIVLARRRLGKLYDGAVVDNNLEMAAAMQAASQLYPERDLQFTAWGHSYGGTVIAEYAQRIASPGGENLPHVAGYHFEAAAAIGEQTFPGLAWSFLKHLGGDVPKNVWDVMMHKRLYSGEQLESEIDALKQLGSMALALPDAGAYIVSNPVRSLREAIACMADAMPAHIKFAEDHIDTLTTVRLPDSDVILPSENMDIHLERLPDGMIVVRHHGHHSTPAFESKPTAQSIIGDTINRATQLEQNSYDGPKEPSGDIRFVAGGLEAYLAIRTAVPFAAYYLSKYGTKALSTTVENLMSSSSTVNAAEIDQAA